MGVRVLAVVQIVPTLYLVTRNESGHYPSATTESGIDSIPRCPNCRALVLR